VQSIRAIHDPPFDKSQHRLVNQGNVGNHGLDAARTHTLIRTRAHPAAQERLAISDRLHHPRVTVLRSGIETMGLAGHALLVRLVREMGMSEFVTQLPVYDLPILNRHNKIVRRTSEMLADSASVISDRGDFHLLS
jgi:hypothetical protein